MKKTEQNDAVDIVKYIMAFCVIAIHTLPLKDVQNEDITRLFDTFVSLAVPFFFLSSGYFVEKKCEAGTEKLLLLDKQIRKLIRYYIVWTLIYLPITIYGFVQSGNGFGKSVVLFFRNVIFQGENYDSWPLWYLLSSIYGFAVFKFIVKKGRKFEGYSIIAICAAVILQAAVDFIMTANVSGNQLVDFLYIFIEKTIGKGRIFSGTYYILIGALIARTKIVGKRKIVFPAWGAAFFAAARWNQSLVKIIMSILFFVFVLMCDGPADGRKFRRTSTIMYYTHMIFFFILNVLCKRSMCGMIGFCFCCLMTNVLAYGLNTSGSCKKSKIVNLLFGPL